MPADPGLDAIASNFTVNDHISATSSSCVTGAGEGKMRFLCIESHLAYVDPMLFPGDPAGAHLHQFYGNTLTNENSTYESLRSAGDGTCQGGPINRTAYWYPAVIRPQNNKVVKPAYIEIYYNAQSSAVHHDDYTPSSGPYGHKTYGTRGLPRGFGMIWGWQTSEGAAPATPAWSRYNQAGTFATFAAMAAGTVDAVDGSSRHSNITSRLESPGCWDGILRPADGRSHVTWTISSAESGNPQICPASHPYRIPHVAVLAVFSHEGEADFSQWYISSDEGHGPPAGTYAGGTTFHNDWFGAWDSDIQEGWEETHLGVGVTSATMKTASAGDLCNNTQLEPDQRPGNHGRVQMATFGNDYYLPVGLRYSDIPEVPAEQSAGDTSFFGFPLLTMRA